MMTFGEQAYHYLTPAALIDPSGSRQASLAEH